MKRNQDCVLRDIGGQALLVPVGAKVKDMNALITLNPTGRRVWELLAEDRTPEALIERITAEFEADPARVQADVRAFLERLEQLGLVEP